MLSLLTKLDDGTFALEEKNLGSQIEIVFSENVLVSLPEVSKTRLWLIYLPQHNLWEMMSIPLNMHQPIDAYVLYTCKLDVLPMKDIVFVRPHFIRQGTCPIAVPNDVRIFFNKYVETLK